MRGFRLAAAVALFGGLVAVFAARAEPAPAGAAADTATSARPPPASTTANIEPPAALTGDPAKPSGETPKDSAAAAASGATPAEVVAPPPPPPHDPIIAAVREKLEGAPASGRNSDALAALKQFYATFPHAPLWIATEGFTDKGKAIVEEIGKASDWGLSASAFNLPAAPGAGALPNVLADAEIDMGVAALRYASHARGGRVDPTSISRNWDRKPDLPDPKALARDLALSADPAAFLRSHHPKHRQFELLRQAVLKARNPENDKPEEARVELPPGANLKPGAEHTDIALLRQRLKIPADAGGETAYDPKLADAVKTFQRENGLKASGILTNATRTALNGPKKPTRAAEIQRLLVNMERWRWMPEDLGPLHVWDNVPEFMMSVVKKGEIIHSEKIIVGKPDTPTPMFSADMLYVVFHPEWGVPDSIKVKEILPYLQGPSFDLFGFGGGSDTRILQRHNLRVNYNGRPIDASRVDWNSVDIRRYSFIQPPGSSNVLGVVKFRFPNKHDVYMHDTPQRELFASQTRTFSHGCMRVQNPRRFAEIVLEEDQGLTAADVGRLLAGSSNNEVTLKTPIPVHVNYFTAVAGEDGKVRTFGDIYAQDGRLAAAMEGRAVPVAGDGYEAGGAPARVAQGKSRKRRPSGDSLSDMVTGLFGN